jgi:hypothetical protein
VFPDTGRRGGPEGEQTISPGHRPSGEAVIEVETERLLFVAIAGDTHLEAIARKSQIGKNKNQIRKMLVSRTALGPQSTTSRHVSRSNSDHPN